MPKQPTIYEVAARAGVSKSLVSLVLRGSQGVSEGRRRAVLDAIEELGYRPNTAASNLAGTRTRTVGMVIDDFANLWFVDLLRGMREVLEPEGYQVLVGDQQMTVVPGHDAIDAFVSMRVEGLVLALDPPKTMDDRHGVPSVVAGERLNVPAHVDKVADDDLQGGALATRHLLELGHSRIVHVSGTGGAAAARRLAYESEMSGEGLEPLVIGEGGGTTEEAAAASMAGLLATRRDFTAVFAANDTMALGCLGALKEVGLSVPADVSLIGYDNSPLAQSTYLDLTTVDSRSLDVGRETARVLLARMTGSETEPQTVLLEPALVVRATTKRRVG